jgi:hypothetical protein
MKTQQRRRKKFFPDALIFSRRLVSDMKIIKIQNTETSVDHAPPSLLSSNNATASCKQKIDVLFLFRKCFVVKMCTV